MMDSIETLHAELLEMLFQYEPITASTLVMEIVASWSSMRYHLKLNRYPQQTCDDFIGLFERLPFDKSLLKKRETGEKKLDRLVAEREGIRWAKALNELPYLETINIFTKAVYDWLLTGHEEKQVREIYWYWFNAW